MKLTPVLFVDAIEPSLPFWVGRLGFEQVASVPDEAPFGFVVLVRDGVEVMLQTRSGLAEDLPAIAAQPPGVSCSLFLEIEDFAAELARLGDAPVLVPERTTFYGMREIVVREPGGHIVIVAARVGGNAAGA